MDTGEIIENCIRKNSNAFSLLVDRFSGFAFSVAFRIINDEEETKDIVQESFIAVWKNIEKYDKTMSFSKWFYKIVVNKCIDSLRRKKRRALIHPKTNDWNLLEPIGDEDPEIKLNNKEIGNTIQLLTNKLSDKQKVIFVLSELEGLSHDEISEITGMAKTTIKSNLNHARRNIGKMIEKYV